MNKNKTSVKISSNIRFSSWSTSY